MLPVVEIRNLSKSYRRSDQIVPVQHEIAFDIDDGAFLALMGPSGSGKSTLLNLIAGIDKPDSGTARVEGIDITFPVAERFGKAMSTLFPVFNVSAETVYLQAGAAAAVGVVAALFGAVGGAAGLACSMAGLIVTC